ncbi:MAG: hypothetical protein Aurels2KO_00590 [Aureliella sp.]
MSVRTPALPSAFSLLAALASFVATLLFTEPALAHPGHSVEFAPADSPLHLLLQPEHVASFLAVLAVGLLCIRTILRHKSASALKPVRVVKK